MPNPISDDQSSEYQSSGRETSVATTTTQVTTPPASDNDVDVPEDEDVGYEIQSDTGSRKPEDCWGDLDYDCPLCSTSRTICPGCTRGLIGEVGHEDLFMGCGVELRCPLCVGEEEAYADKDFWRAHYHDNNTEETTQYSRMQEADIEKKYPGWLARQTA